MTIKEIWNHAWQALNPKDTEGFSIKKVIAALFSIHAVVMTWIYVDDANFVAVLSLWLAFILSVLGIRYAEKKANIQAP